jgi:imidazoleglycerol phosphate synthase glutamine amidotransferase subunit HisH
VKVIGLFNHHPECSNDSCLGITKALEPNYKVKWFDVRTDLDLVLDNADAICFPGGIGDSDSYFDFFTRSKANKIAAFLSRGGRYVGICMGAYWAGSRYFDFLDGVDAVQYIKRPTAEIHRSYGTVAQVKWNRHQPDQSTEIMFFYDGCTFLGDGEYTLMSTYLNNDPMAIIQGNLGLIGCHPESMPYWYEKPYQYINQYWHNERHHDLLLGFVNKLMLP